MLASNVALGRKEYELDISYLKWNVFVMTLIAQNDFETVPDGSWRQTAYRDLSERLSPPSGFPCTFSQNAFRRELIEFAFVDSIDERALQEAAQDLGQYVKDCGKWDGRVASAKPLLMIFSESAARFETVAEYRDFGWRMLQSLHDSDASPWPQDVATDPEQPFWSFCFSGTQLFVNMSFPAHVKRKSRNLGRHLTLVINPRERFDLVAGDSVEGRRVRNKIRQRAADYDGVEHSPLLGSYEKGELEWVQYALAEENVTQVGRCPFRFHG